MLFRSNATIVATQANSTGNGLWGYECNGGFSYINAGGAQASGNGSGDFHPTPNAFANNGSYITR